jgi:hypothetical protein
MEGKSASANANVGVYLGSAPGAGYPHTRDDQALSTPPVRQRAGYQLSERPDERIRRLDHSDVGYRHAMRAIPSVKLLTSPA